jgi:hydrogenase expression/formation protein HypE
MKNNPASDQYFGLSCPIPISEYPTVTLAHGGGGKLSHQLVEKIFVPQFYNEHLNRLHDGAIIDVEQGRVAFSTDSYVVDPITFPGGDIGKLAVTGTINDLAMCGARPLYLSAGLIIEEGFSMEKLWKIILSMKRAADESGVQIVTGDTKVVDRGKADKIFINTSGIGIIPEGVIIDPQRASVGDKIILSGPIAEHGIAIMSTREGLAFETPISSDCAALDQLVGQMLDASNNIHVLRDPTRGGVASVLNEVAQKANKGIRIEEKLIPVHEAVKGACELLGLDPLYVANEGKLIAFVPPHDADKVLSSMKSHPLGKNAVIIGEVVDEHPGFVVMQSSIGGKRIVDMLSGEQLPRIC